MLKFKKRFQFLSRSILNFKSISKSLVSLLLSVGDGKVDRIQSKLKIQYKFPEYLIMIKRQSMSNQVKIKIGSVNWLADDFLLGVFFCFTTNHLKNKPPRTHTELFSILLCWCACFAIILVMHLVSLTYSLCNLYTKRELEFVVCAFS